MDGFVNYISNNAHWIFEGIGTNIVSLIIGGIIGYFVGAKKTLRQVQKGEKETIQNQELRVSSENDGDISLSQHQKGGDKSIQTQVGEINARKK